MSRNLEWAVDRLNEYLDLLRELDSIYRSNIVHAWQTKPFQDAVSRVRAAYPTAERIVQHTRPESVFMEPRGSDWVKWGLDHIRSIELCIADIEAGAELDRHWSPEPTIEMRTGDLHPWVWEAAKSLWATGHYGEAIEAAAKIINYRMQEACGRRDVSGTSLVRDALSKNPPTSGVSRLRVAADDGSDTYASRQEGAMHLGEAVFMLFRNVEAHDITETPLEEAVEALAAMSAFARLVEGAELVESDS